jgi:Mg2+ and Co2+ transporter CorA
MNPGEQKVEKYAPKIIDKWQELGSKVEKPATARPAISSSFVIDRKVLEEEIIRKELQKVRDEFLKEAEALERDRLTAIEARLRKDFEKELRDKTEEIERAFRIINIQTAILSRLYENNKDILLQILRDADISEDDLKILSGRLEGE